MDKKHITSTSTSSTSFCYSTSGMKFKKGDKNYKRWLVSEKLFKHYHRWEKARNGNWQTYGRIPSISYDKNGNLIK